MRVATRTISGLYDGATTAELDRLSIQTAAEMIGEEPQYSRLAARLLAGYIDKEVRNQGVASFSQSVALGHAEGLIGDETAPVRQGQRPQARLRRSTARPTAASSTSGCAPSTTATCCGTPSTRLVIETPQYFLLRVACGLAQHAGRGDRVLPADVVAGLPAEQPDAVQLRHPAHPDVVVLPGRLPPRRPRLDLRPLRTGRQARRSSPAASASRSRGSARAAR